MGKSKKEKRTEARELLLSLSREEVLEELVRLVPGHDKMEIAELLRMCVSSLGGEEPESDDVLSIYIDGASLGNPGPSGIGAVIKDSGGKVIRELSRHIGVATNNVAEYKALLAGLEEAKRLGARRVEVYADSELVVNQVGGTWRIKDDKLKPLFSAAKKLLDSFSSHRLEHIERDKNRAADRLAKRGADNAR
jgi:ribonuclease HI